MNAYIIAGYRSAVGKAPRGKFRFTRPDDLAAKVIQHLMSTVPNLAKEQVDDVIVGNATPEAEQGLNIGRMISLMGLNTDKVPGMTVNRYSQRQRNAWHSSKTSRSIPSNSVEFGAPPVVTYPAVQPRSSQSRKRSLIVRRVDGDTSPRVPWMTLSGKVVSCATRTRLGVRRPVRVKSGWLASTSRSRLFTSRCNCVLTAQTNQSLNGGTGPMMTAGRILRCPSPWPKVQRTTSPAFTSRSSGSALSAQAR